MKKKTLKEIANKMKKLDFCMMTTQDGRGVYHSRPMSNNGEVEYDGNSWFFSYEDTGKVKQLKTNQRISLTFQTDDMLYVHVYGQGHIIYDKDIMKEHWNPDLKMWFPEGIDTKGVVLIQVEAKKIQYWHKEDEGEFDS